MLLSAGPGYRDTDFSVIPAQAGILHRRQDSRLRGDYLQSAITA
jgi:hypothetical protein